MASSPCFNDDEDDKLLTGKCEKDLDALRQACRLSEILSAGGSPYSDLSFPEEINRNVQHWNYSESEDDEELLFSVQKRLGSSLPLFLHEDGPSFSDEEEKDEEILRSVKRRFATLDHLESKIRQHKSGPVKAAAKKQPDNFVESLNGLQLGCKAEATSNFVEKVNGKTSGKTKKGIKYHLANQICSSSRSSSKCPMKVDVESSIDMLGDGECILDESSTINEENQADVQRDVLVFPGQLELFDDSSIEVAEERHDWGYKGCIGASETTIVLSDALKKNQLCQKALRCKLTQVESKLKENKELQKRVRTLIDFEKLCRRRFAGIIGHENYPAVKLISTYKKKESTTKGNELPVSFGTCRPPENEDVEKLTTLKKNFPLVFKPRNWSMKERKELAKGVKQQIQESAVRLAMQSLSEAGCLSGAASLDEQIKALAKREFTDTDIRSALPDVNWKDVARIYVVGRSGTECMMQWLNHDDPLINHGPWTKEEDKKLLSISQKHDRCRWDLIAEELGTNRTPAQCLMRYQRSLNSSIIRGAWTVEEDEQLRSAVELYGELDWLMVAASLEGRTSSQCFNRWHKILHPVRQKSGRWDVEEDKRLRLTVAVYGPRQWRKVASHVPGRTDVQCRERWCNVLDPSLKLEEWTMEEDNKLEEAVMKHGKHHWSLVAVDLKPRTDNQCWRRWKSLHPETLIEFQKDAQIKKIALINNFVGRAKERPRIGPSDFVSELTASLEFSSALQKQKQPVKTKEGTSKGNASKNTKLAGGALTKKQASLRHRTTGTDVKKSTKKKSVNPLRKRREGPVESATKEQTSSQPVTVATESGKLRKKRSVKPLLREEKSPAKPVGKVQTSSEGYTIIGSECTGKTNNSGEHIPLRSDSNVRLENNEYLLIKNLDNIPLESLLAKGVPREIAKVRRDERKWKMKLKRSLGMLQCWSNKEIVQGRSRKRPFVEREHQSVEKRGGENDSDITNVSQTMSRSSKKRRKHNVILTAKLSSGPIRTGKQRKTDSHTASKASSSLAHGRSQSKRKEKMEECATVPYHVKLRSSTTNVAQVKPHPQTRQKFTISTSLNDSDITLDSGKRKKGACNQHSKTARSFGKEDAISNSTNTVEMRRKRKLSQNGCKKRMKGKSDIANGRIHQNNGSQESEVCKGNDS